jgi:hypothetical protein
MSELARRLSVSGKTVIRRLAEGLRERRNLHDGSRSGRRDRQRQAAET